MDNLAPVSKLDPSELPQGFTATDPNSTTGPQNAATSQDQQREGILEQALTPEALTRLRRIKLVKAEKAIKVENAIVAMALSGKLPDRINEGKLIEMLERGNARQSSSAAANSISIQRKKYALDSDDEDDNDDDL
jgi:programmed cell death protein 5